MGGGDEDGLNILDLDGTWLTWNMERVMTKTHLRLILLIRIWRLTSPRVYAASAHATTRLYIE